MLNIYMHVFAKKTLKRLYKTLSALVFLRLGLSGREREREEFDYLTFISFGII